MSTATQSPLYTSPHRKRCACKSSLPAKRSTNGRPAGRAAACCCSFYPCLHARVVHNQVGFYATVHTYTPIAEGKNRIAVKIFSCNSAFFCNDHVRTRECVGDDAFGGKFGDEIVGPIKVERTMAAILLPLFKTEYVESCCYCQKSVYHQAKAAFAAFAAAAAATWLADGRVRTKDVTPHVRTICKNRQTLGRVGTRSLSYIEAFLYR